MGRMPTSSTTATDDIAHSGAERLADTAVAGDLAFLLARANAVSIAAANAALAEHGLKVRQYSVLALAADQSRPSQRELAEFLRLDPSQIVALIDELEARGFVVREPDPTDRRAKVVAATAAGRRMYAKARRTVVASEVECFGVLNDQERCVLTDLLRRLAFPAR